MNPSSDVENQKGNGASNGPEGHGDDTPSLGDLSRQIQHDAETLTADVHDATDGVRRYLTEQVAQRPYRTLGVAAGIGYALGGGLSSRLTTLVFGAATRLAMALAARELGTRFLQGNSVQNKSS